MTICIANIPITVKINLITAFSECKFGATKIVTYKLTPTKNIQIKHRIMLMKANVASNRSRSSAESLKTPKAISKNKWWMKSQNFVGDR